MTAYGVMMVALVVGYALGRIRPVSRLAMHVRWDANDPPGRVRQTLTLALLAVLEPVWFWTSVRHERRCRRAVRGGHA